MRAAAASIFAGGKRGGFSLPSPRTFGSSIMCPLKTTTWAGSTRCSGRLAEEGAQLLLGPVDHGGGFGDDLAAKFELAEEIELLA